MSVVALTLRNYRSIGSQGARLPLDHEFVAIVGVNNAGKSTLLRALYELRPMINYLAGASTGDGRFMALFTDVGAEGIQTLTLGAGERIERAGDTTAQPRITFEFGPEEADAALGIRKLTVVLPRPNALRVELVLQDGTLVSNLSGLMLMQSEFGYPVVRANSPDGSEIRFDWRPAQQALKSLADSMYIGPFRNAVNSGGASYYDLSVGKDFITQFDQYKTGDSYQSNESVRLMLRELATIFGFASLDVNANPAKDALVYSVDDRSFRGAEQGAGISQFVIVAANVLVRRPTFLLIDEPELSLHASLQLRMLTFLAKYVHGPIIFATHSLGLARAAADRVMVATTDQSQGAQLHDYKVASNLSSVLGELGYGGLNDGAYQAVLLVEGVTEVRVFQELLHKYGVRNQVVIVPLGGDDIANRGRVLELAELKRLSDLVFAVVDSERTSESSPPAQRRLDFAQNCKDQGIDCLVLERRATENYLDPTIAASLMGISDVVALGAFDKIPKGWAKEKNWRVANAMDEAAFAGTDLDAFLRRLVAKLDLTA